MPAFLAVAALVCPEAGAVERSPREAGVKAAFLFKFGSYVEWPPEASPLDRGSLVIGVMGADLLAEQLRTIVEGRTQGGVPVVVRTLAPGDPVDGLHVLFLGDTERQRQREVLAALAEQTTLSVSEAADTFALGSVINFVIEDEKVRFDVSLPAAERARLAISSRLLDVARDVVLDGAP